MGLLKPSNGLSPCHVLVGLHPVPPVFGSRTFGGRVGAGLPPPLPYDGESLTVGLLESSARGLIPPRVVTASGYNHRCWMFRLAASSCCCCGREVFSLPIPKSELIRIYIDLNTQNLTPIYSKFLPRNYSVSTTDLKVSGYNRSLKYPLIFCRVKTDFVYTPRKI